MDENRKKSEDQFRSIRIYFLKTVEIFLANDQVELTSGIAKLQAGQQGEFEKLLARSRNLHLSFTRSITAKNTFPGEEIKFRNTFISELLDQLEQAAKLLDKGRVKELADQILEIAENNINRKVTEGANDSEINQVIFGSIRILALASMKMVLAVLIKYKP